MDARRLASESQFHHPLACVAFLCLIFFISEMGIIFLPQWVVIRIKIECENT